MKKLIRIIALILVLVMIFTGTASADDFSNLEGWMNVLDYDTVNGSGSNTFTNSGEFVAKFYFPYQTSLGFIDAIVWSSRSFTVTNNNDDPLTVTYIGSNLYRVYGNSPNWHSSYLYLKFVVSSSASMQIKSLYMANSNYMHAAEVGKLTVGSSSYTMSSTTSSVSHIFSSSSQYGSFTASVSCPNWKKYDFIDFYITCFTEGLDSVYGRFGSIDLPLSVSYLGGSSGVSAAEANNKIMIRADLRGLDRSKTDVPIIELSGVHDNVDNNKIVLVQVNGYVVTETMSPLMFYFTKLQLSLSSWFETLQARQDAMHQDQLEFHESNLAALYDIKSQLDAIRSQLVTNLTEQLDSLHSDLIKNLTSMQTAIVDKIGGFQTSMETWFSTVSGKLDQLIGGTTEGDDLSQGASDLEDQIGEIQDYEQSQQEILDNNLPAIQESVTLTGFTGALAFVQRYLNGIFLGIGDFKIVFAMPIVIGIFFFICNRIPGATRFGSSRPPRSGKK